MAILDTLPGSVEMAACMRCGRTVLAFPIVTEDRPHDVQFHGYCQILLVNDARAWASAWPRFAILNDARVYLSASARFASLAELENALTGAAAAQECKTLREILLELGIPASGPPVSLPDQLDGFLEIWSGLQFDDATPLEELLEAATRFNGPHRLAREVLARRKDLQQQAMLLLWNQDDDKRRLGRYLVEEFRLVGDDILLPLQIRLGELDDNQTGELQQICSLLGRMPATATAPLIPDIEATAARVKDRDYYAHKDLTALLLRFGRPQPVEPTLAVVAEVEPPPRVEVLTAREVLERYWTPGAQQWLHSSPRARAGFDTELATRVFETVAALEEILEDPPVVEDGVAFRVLVNAWRGRWVIVTVLREDAGQWRVDLPQSIGTTARMFLAQHQFHPPFTGDGDARGRAMMFWHAVHKRDARTVQDVSLMPLSLRIGDGRMDEFLWYLGQTDACVRVLMNLETECRIWKTQMVQRDGAWFVAAID